jgi:N-acetylglutamate synthase-like GNAT family acetyltransferase
MSITYEFIDAKPFWDFFQEARKILFETNFDFDVQAVMSEKEKLKSRELNEVFKPVKDYYLVAKDGDNIIGWSFGIQKSNHDFYMINSAVFSEYRRKGIYTELMKQAVAHIKELGFQYIYSRHKLTNNDILIPKLKFGFNIVGMEVNDMFGNLVILGYYTNEKRRELLEIRAGMRKMNEEYMKLVK